MAANKTTILISARDQASKAFGRVARNSTMAQKKVFGVNNALKTTDKSMRSLSASVKGLAGGLVAGLGVVSLSGVAKEAISVKIEFDRIRNVLKAVTGSSKAAGEELNFLSGEAERLGIQLRPLAQSYTRLAAAGRLLGLTTENTREIFTSFSEALTGFGASREQSIRVFTAIEQILSKGKVSAEELRQQLGEALPGSFQLAAKAAGVTVQELDGMLKGGELLSSDFILPFAKAVRDEFGGAAVEGAKLLNAEFSRTIDILDKVKLAFAEGGEKGRSLSDAIANVLKKVREFLSDQERLNKIGEWGQTLGEGLQIAAKALISISKTLSAIPTEALVAVGALALGGRGGGLKGAIASAVSTQPVTQAFSATRSNRNFLNSVGQGGINDSNLGSVRGILGARAGFSSSEVLRRERRDLQSRLFSRPRSRKAQLGPDSLISPSQALSGQFGQDKLAKSFEKTFIVATETVKKSLASKIASSRVGMGLKSLGGTLATATKSVGSSLLGLVSPLNLVIAALPIFASWISEINQRNKEATRWTQRGNLAQAQTIAFNAARRQNVAGTFNVNQAVTEFKQEASRLGLTINQAMVDTIVKSINSSKTTQEALKLTKQKETRKEIENLFTPSLFSRAKDLLSGLSTAVDKTKNAFNELYNNAITPQREAFNKNIKAIKKEILIRETSTGKETERLIRLNNLFQTFKEQGFFSGEAEQKARQQLAAEQRLKTLKEPTQVERRSSAVGTATKARSVDAALKKQQRREDQRFNVLKSLAEQTANSTESIAETLTSFNTSFT